MGGMFVVTDGTGRAHRKHQVSQEPRAVHDPCDNEQDAGHGYLSNKDDHLKRLRRIEGQVGGLARMVADERYCIDILTQVSATTRALESLALKLLDEHLRPCVVRAAREGGEEAEVKLAEARDAIARLVRS